MHALTTVNNFLQLKILISLLSFIVLPTFASDFVFKHFDTNDGLTQNSVLSITQDQLGFMWFGTRNGLNRFDSRHFKTYQHENRPNSLGNDHVNALYTAPDGEIWIGTERGVYIYSTLSDSFRHFNTISNEKETITGNVNLITGHGNTIYIGSIGQGVFIYDLKTRRLRQNRLQGIPSVISMAIDQRGQVWVGCFRSGLFTTHDNFRTLQSVTDATGSAIYSDKTITGIATSNDGRIYFCTTDNGLSVFAKGHVEQILTAHAGESLYGHSLTWNRGQLLMTTEVGLFIYDPKTASHTFHKYEATNPYSLSDEHLQTAFTDRDGGIWLGSYFGGVNYSPHLAYSFRNYFPRIDVPTSFFGRRVRQMDEDSEGRIWVGTEDNGLGYINPTDGTSHAINTGIYPANIQSLRVIGNQVWAGIFQHGVKVFDTHTGKPVGQFRAKYDDGLSDDNVFCIQSLHDGRVAFGTLGGLDIYDPQTSRISQIRSLPRQIIYSILEDHKYNLWVAVYGHGIYMLPHKGDKWHRFTGKGQKIDNTVCLFEDSRGQLWVATDGDGVSRYDMRHRRFVQVPVPAYNSKQVILGIAEAQRDGGQLWMTSNEGLLCYNPSNHSTRIFTSFNGMFGSNSTYGSIFYSHAGQLYVGCQGGLTSFDTAPFLNNKPQSTILATALTINGQEVECTTKGGPLVQNIATTKELHLAYSQNSFSLQLGVLSFRDNQQHQLTYKLEGFDRQWQYLFSDNHIRYTNLPSGHYQLIVKDQTAGDSIFRLPITIAPPWWNTWWAWVIYVLTVTGIVYFVYLYLTQRTEAHHQVAMEKFKYEKEKELYQSRINFFTNVAHEIRTPLTLIRGPLTDILSKKGHDRATLDDLDIMNMNVDRLLDLTNQLLDFRKTEIGGMKLNLEKTDIGQLIQGVYVRFTSIMKRNHIQGQLVLPEEPCLAYIDKSSLTKIISNLTNNAVKYCDHMVQVKLTYANDSGHFLVEFSNDGPLVPAEQRKLIFKPFYRAESAKSSPHSGTGIGLALAQTLAQLHGGSITMKADDSLNIFLLDIPIGSRPTIELPKQPSAQTMAPDDTLSGTTQQDSDENSLTVADSTPTVLIVEDNAQMAYYEQSHLGSRYHVLTAANGEEALQKLHIQDVDLIVSDVMMAPMDGFELCRRVKENIETSHIPIVLLTALTLDSAKIKGMESGADSYIEKPFSMDYLLHVVQNLLHTRQSLKNAYATSPFTRKETVAISKADTEFMKRLEKVVSENLIDSDFGITQLASQMFMSRTNLNRKIRGTFNLTPNDYIKVERLKRAAQLMREGDYKVNEVCYQVGFTSPSYFTQCFKKQFGLLPKDFIQKSE